MLQSRGHSMGPHSSDCPRASELRLATYMCTWGDTRAPQRAGQDCRRLAQMLFASPQSQREHRSVEGGTRCPDAQASWNYF